MDAPRLTWARVAEHYADLPGEADHFLALDGNVEVGVVKLVPTPASSEWMWSMLLTHPGPVFRRPTNGRCQTRGQAAAELRACYAAFRAYYEIAN